MSELQLKLEIFELLDKSNKGKSLRSKLTDKRFAYLIDLLIRLNLDSKIKNTLN